MKHYFSKYTLKAKCEHLEDELQSKIQLICITINVRQLANIFLNLVIGKLKTVNIRKGLGLKSTPKGLHFIFVMNTVYMVHNLFLNMGILGRNTVNKV